MVWAYVVVEVVDDYCAARGNSGFLDGRNFSLCGQALTGRREALRICAIPPSSRFCRSVERCSSFCCGSDGTPTGEVLGHNTSLRLMASPSLIGIRIRHEVFGEMRGRAWRVIQAEMLWQFLLCPLPINGTWIRFGKTGDDAFQVTSNGNCLCPYVVVATVLFIASTTAV